MEERDGEEESLQKGCFFSVAVLKQVFGLRVCGGIMPVSDSNWLFLHTATTPLLWLRDGYIPSYRFSQDLQSIKCISI